MTFFEEVVLRRVENFIQGVVAGLSVELGTSNFVFAVAASPSPNWPLWADVDSLTSQVHFRFSGKKNLPLLRARPDQAHGLVIPLVLPPSGELEGTE